MGGRTSYNIRIEWLKTRVNDELQTIKPKDRDGDVVCFSKITGHDVIASLPKNATFTIWVDEFYSFLDANNPASFLARLTSRDQIRGEVREVTIPISLGHGRVQRSYGWLVYYLFRENHMIKIILQNTLTYKVKSDGYETDQKPGGHPRHE